ncbi:MAG: tetratricopeptide repeat protein, partial [Verrucomicrobiales bacterium]
SDPNNARLLRQLADCQFRSGKEVGLALRTIDQAIELEPNDPINHVIRSLILADQHQPKLAKKAAEEAITLEPEEPAGYSALANAHMRARAWQAAEIAAKQALALDPDEEMAANLLAHALFCQGKQVENQVHIEGLLQQDPEDPYTHYAAGLAALQGEDYPKAEQHFLEALRLNPSFDPAREGLLNVFRARSIVYRSYLRYAFFMTRLSPGQRVGFMVGLLIGVQVFMRSLKDVSPPMSLAIGALYILFVVWTYVATSVGSLIVLGDRRARHTLKPIEKLDAILVGGGVVLGVGLVIVGLIGSIGWYSLRQGSLGFR